MDLKTPPPFESLSSVPHDLRMDIKHGARRRPPRLAAETAAAYEAFICYYELPIPRSQKAVAARLRKSRSLISRWASRYFWSARVQAADAAAAEAEGLQRTAQTEIEDALRLGTAIERRLLQELSRRLEDPAELQRLSDDEIVRLHDHVSSRLTSTSALAGTLRAERDKYDEIFSSMPDEQLAKFIHDWYANWEAGNPFVDEPYDLVDPDAELRIQLAQAHEARAASLRNEEVRG